MDDDQFIFAADEMTRFIANYTNSLANKSIPVMPPSNFKPQDLIKMLPQEAPEQGETFEKVMEDVKDKIMPTSTHWHHPNFFAYFPTSTSYPSILGDMLSSAIACIGFSWIASPACTELEVLTLDWMVKAMGLPKHFLSVGNRTEDGTPSKGLGVIQTSASAASLMIILSLRSEKIREAGDCSPGALTDKMVVYFSDQAHSSVERACKIALVQSRVIATLPSEGFKLNAQRLEKAIQQDVEQGLTPLVCFTTLGTTNSCVFDDLESITKVCNALNLWCHVDAAYAGSALVCPEFRNLAKGIENVDSFNYNPHKMQRVSFDCSVLWVRDNEILNNSFNIDPTYLKHDFEGMPEYRNCQISLGRRFRSLKLWFVIRIFGLEGLRDYIRKHCKLAKKFESLMRSNEKFQVINQVDMGLVCFRLYNSDKATKALNEKLKAQREIYLVPGSFKNSLTGEKEDGFYFLRFVVCSYLAEECDVVHAYEIICKIADELPVHK